MPPTRSMMATDAAIANHDTNRDQATSTTSAAQHACASADKPNKHHHHATAEQAPSYEVLTSTSPNRRAKPPTTQALPLHHGPPCRAAPSLPDAVAASSCPRTGAKQPATARNGRGPPGPRRAQIWPARSRQPQCPRPPPESNPTATSIEAAPRPPPSPGAGHRDLRCSRRFPPPWYPHSAGKLPQGRRRSRSCRRRLRAGFARRSPPATAGEEVVGRWR
jgi:hypothetical protein